MMRTILHRYQQSWLGVDTDDDTVDTDEDDDDAVATDEDDTDGEDASQAPAFLAGCGHWTNIHFEMGLPTTPMHSILCTSIHCTVL